MKGKILDSYKTIYPGKDNEIISYTVVKETKYGTFKGTVTICNEDMPIDNETISDMAGYDYAERKCDIQAVHQKSIIMRERANGIKFVLNTLQMKYAELEKTQGALVGTDDCLKSLKWQYEIANREYKRVYNQYVYMRDDFRDYTDRRNAFRKKSLERKEEIDKRSEK